jgi:septation ring formation regulator EzrA
MTTSVQAQLWDSQAENSQLKANIEMQRRSIELLQARVAVNHQLQAQVKSLTAEVSHINSELTYSRNAYRGIQVQHDDFVVRHTKALDDAKGLREQFDQSQSRCAQAEKRLTVLETELESLRNKMRKAREVLDDSGL